MLADRPEHRPHPAAGRRPGGRGVAAALDPAHPQGRPGPLEQRVLGAGRAPCCCRARCSTPTGRLGRSVLLRARGHRAGLAGVGPGHVAWYAGDLVANHPVDRPDAARRTTTGSTPATACGSPGATCPCVLVPFYVGSWTRDPGAALGAPARRRCRRGSAAGATGGARPGRRGGRSEWRTVWRDDRVAGRPPGAVDRNGAPLPLTLGRGIEERRATRREARQGHPAVARAQRCRSA